MGLQNQRDPWSHPGCRQSFHYSVKAFPVSPSLAPSLWSNESWGTSSLLLRKCLSFWLRTVCVCGLMIWAEPIILRPSCLLPAPARGQNEGAEPTRQGFRVTFPGRQEILRTFYPSQDKDVLRVKVFSLSCPSQVLGTAGWGTARQRFSVQNRESLGASTHQLHSLAEFKPSFQVIFQVLSGDKTSRNKELSPTVSEWV